MPSLPATMYNINFTTNSGGPTPTSGSFTYDPGTGFSAFVVIWDGFTFDLTSPANAPSLSAVSTGCTSRASTQQYGFIIMSEAASGCTPSYNWSGGIGAGGGIGGFGFGLVVGMFAGDAINQTIFIGSNPGAHAQGTWSIVAADAPDPSSLGLMLAGILVVAGKFAFTPRKSFPGPLCSG